MVLPSECTKCRKWLRKKTEWEEKLPWTLVFWAIYIFLEHVRLGSTSLSGIATCGISTKFYRCFPGVVPLVAYGTPGCKDPTISICVMMESRGIGRANSREWARQNDTWLASHDAVLCVMAAREMTSEVASPLERHNSQLFPWNSSLSLLITTLLSLFNS